MWNSAEKRPNFRKTKPAWTCRDSNIIFTPAADSNFKSILKMGIPTKVWPLLFWQGFRKRFTLLALIALYKFEFCLVNGAWGGQFDKDLINWSSHDPNVGAIRPATTTIKSSIMTSFLIFNLSQANTVCRKQIDV